MTVIYRWRTFTEEEPDEHKDILVWSGTSPVYWCQRSERYGRRITYNGISWMLSQCKKRLCPPKVLLADNERNEKRKKAYYAEHKEHIRIYYKEWYEEQKEVK